MATYPVYELLNKIYDADTNALNVIIEGTSITGATVLTTLKLANGETVNGISSATTLSENSNSYLATQKAVKAYVDDRVYIKSTQIDVSKDSTTYPDLKTAVDYCNASAPGPMIIRIFPGDYDVSETIEINCAYPISILGFGTNVCTLYATTGLTTTPMFDILTETDMSRFSLIANSGYGLIDDQCAIDIGVAGLYNEFHQMYIKGFYKGYESDGDSNTWFFDSIIENCQYGLWTSGGSIGASELTISNCQNSIFIEMKNTGNCYSFQNIIFDIRAGQTGITYKDNNIKPLYHYATGNNFYGAGTYISGFTFDTAAQTDIRYESNPGLRNYYPESYIENVASASTTLTLQNIYYKINFTGNTSANLAIKFTQSNNKTTYLPSISRVMTFSVTGDIQCDAAGQDLKIAIIKNGITGATEVVKCTSRCVTQNVGYNFAMSKLITVNTNDYFEIYAMNTTSASDTLKLTDLNWTIKP